MSEHLAIVEWQRNGAVFVDDRYSRAHQWRFDGGAEVAASASPQVVPEPCSDATAVDPEEAFVASLSSCHMLWFLSIARKHGYLVEHYHDQAVGVLGRNTHGKLAITTVTLRPRVQFSGERQPDADALRTLHEQAHQSCFIAHSVLTEVRCEPALIPQSSKR